MVGDLTLSSKGDRHLRAVGGNLGAGELGGNRIHPVGLAGELSVVQVDVAPVGVPDRAVFAGFVPVQPQAVDRYPQVGGRFVARNHRVFEDYILSLGPGVVGGPGLGSHLQVHLGGVLLGPDVTDRHVVAEGDGHLYGVASAVDQVTARVGGEFHACYGGRVVDVALSFSIIHYGQSRRGGLWRGQHVRAEAAVVCQVQVFVLELLVGADPREGDVGASRDVEVVRAPVVFGAVADAAFLQLPL